MFQILWINQAVMNGSGNRACGFFSSDACFSDFNTLALKFTPNMQATDEELQSSATPTDPTMNPMSISWMSQGKL